MDLIERQAAVNAMAELQGRASTKAELKGISNAWKRIKQLPSVQPEIIYCKDCKHYKASEYTGRMACHYVIGGTAVRNLNDFCSRAEKES